jgi:hypothetical protein
MLARTTGTTSAFRLRGELLGFAALNPPDSTTALFALHELGAQELTYAAVGHPAQYSHFLRV